MNKSYWLLLTWSIAVTFSLINPLQTFATDSKPQAQPSPQQKLVRHSVSTEQTATAPELARLGEWPVGVSTVKLINPKQLSTADFTSLVDRSLTVEIWYPSTAKRPKNVASYSDETRSGKPFTIQGSAYRDIGFSEKTSKFPLLVMSHGYTGYRTMMYYLGEHLASPGYVVASIDHTDSTNADVNFSENAGSGFPSTLYNRARDQQFVLNALTQSASKFSAIIKPDSAAILGYSMGGYGALNTVGGCYDFSADALVALGFPTELASSLAPAFNTCSAAQNKTDDRWKAMIAFAPWGGEQSVHKPESLAKVEIPSLVVGGDYDDISGFENGIEKLYQQIGAKQKYLMVYENARHNIVAHPAPEAAFGNDLDIGHYYEPSWSSETIAQINKHMVRAFLDCHVKGLENACDYLPQRETAAQIKQADGKLTKPWPGFADRWGLGLRFLRGDSTIEKRSD